MSELKIVNERKEPITLTSCQKNEIYRNAKRLKEQLRDRMCSKRECEHPTEQNVRKMLLSEFKSQKDIETFKNSMKVIGADLRDCSPEKIRRR